METKPTPDDRIKNVKLIGMHNMARIGDIDATSLANMAWVDSRAYDSFDDALAANYGTDTTILVADSEKISRDIHVPFNIQLRVERSGLLDISEGATLYIDGALDAGAYQIFGGNKNVDFGKSARIPLVYPQWFGTIGDGLIDDTRAIQKAIDSLTSGGTVYFCRGLYLIKRVLTLSDNIKLVGSDWTAEINVASGCTCNAIEGTDVTEVEIENMGINGNGVAGDGIYFSGVTKSVVVGCRVKNCQYGINEAGSSDYNLILGNMATDNVTAGVTTTGAHTTAANNIE